MDQQPQKAPPIRPGLDFVLTRPGESAGTSDALCDLANRFAAAAERALARHELGGRELVSMDARPTLLRRDPGDLLRRDSGDGGNAPGANAPSFRPTIAIPA